MSLKRRRRVAGNQAQQLAARVAAGTGNGKLREILGDAVKRGYDGFAVLEPHLLGGGPTGGVTGPDLFPKAVAAFTKVLDQAGAKYQ